MGRTPPAERTGGAPLSLATRSASIASTEDEDDFFAGEPAPAGEARGAADFRSAPLGDSAFSPAAPATQVDSLQNQLDSLRQEFDRFRQQLNPAKPKYPSVELHGVFQVDSVWFHQSENNRATVGDIQDGASFRRARLSANGAVAPNLNYFLQMDFAFPGRPTFTDLWFEVTEVPLLGNVRVGQWKQPFSLEVVSSFRYTTFAERSLLFQTFTPFRHIALGFYDHAEDERSTWAASVYRPGQDQFGGSLADNGGYAGVARLTHLPLWDDSSNGAQYLHLGGAYNYVAPNNQLARFRTIPEYFAGEQVGQTPAGTSGVAIPGALNGTPFFVDTTTLEVDHYHLFGTELLWVDGPLSIQSEVMWLAGQRTTAGSFFFPGFYAQAGYFLTGEHRPYNRKLGAIDRIQVLNPFGCSGHDECCSGWGAWELAARVSHVDLTDSTIRGGRLTDLTLGLNWYLNNFTKFQLNYIHAFLDNPTLGDSTADIFGLRGQVDF